MAEEQRKICTSCYVGRPLSDFRLNKRVLPSGVVRLYYSSPCRICRRKLEKEQRGVKAKTIKRVNKPQCRRQYQPATIISTGHRTSTDKTHAQHLRWTYGLSLEDYNKIYDRQRGRCAICQRKPHQIPSRQRRRLVVDHDHTTEQVRGLLCHDCNLALGLFRDNPVLIEAAMAYLKGYSCHSSNSSENKEICTAGDSSGHATCLFRSKARMHQR